MTTTRRDPRCIYVPWTPDQVAALNRYQQNGWMHPFTCRHRDTPGHQERPAQDLGQLVATPDGWRCQDCDYRQSWAWLAMTVPPGRPPWAV